jgi:cytochrome b561
MTFNADALRQDQSATQRYLPRNYRRTAKVLHWMTAALVFAMIASGVVMKQLGSGSAADALFSLHKLMGAVTFLLILARVGYRLTRPGYGSTLDTHRRPIIHWMLYAVIILIPLLGWAGVSDYGSREIFAGYSLPAIWPEGAGYYSVLLEAHAYVAFAMLGLVAVHIGLAIQDHVMRSQSE